MGSVNASEEQNVINETKSLGGHTRKLMKKYQRTQQAKLADTGGGDLTDEYLQKVRNAEFLKLRTGRGRKSSFLAGSGFTGPGFSSANNYGGV